MSETTEIEPGMKSFSTTAPTSTGDALRKAAYPLETAVCSLLRTMADRIEKRGIRGVGHHCIDGLPQLLSAAWMARNLADQEDNVVSSLT